MPKLATLAITFLLALLLTAGGAQATETGINSQDLSAQETVERADALNARWIRRFVSWSELQPQENGPFSENILAYLDQLTAQASLRGQKVMFAFNGAPSWANGSSDPQVPPKSAEQYADFMGKIAARYRGKVAAYELWNEPDATEFWHGDPSPEAYAPILKAGYTSIKAADPSTLVLAGPFTGNNYNFLEGLYRVGSKGFFDGVSTHTDTACNLKSPYDYYRDPNGRVGQYTFLGFREVHQVMEDHGDGSKPIIMSELGWSTTTEVCSRTARAGTKPGGVSEAEQNLFLKQAYNCLARYPYTTVGIWFTLRDISSRDSELSRYGLMNHSFVPKPSYASMALVGERGNLLNEPCGDFDGPALTVSEPRQDEIYNGILSFSVKASDSQSSLARIRIFANDVRLRSVTGLKNGQTANFYWFGARTRPPGPIKITVEAKDSFGNTTRKDITVNKVDPKKLPPQTTSMKLSISGKGSKKTARGQVYVKNTQLTPTGVIRLSWQRRSGSSWKTVYKDSKFTTKPYKVTRRLKSGKWRLRAQYDKDYPFSKARKTSKTFTVR